MARVGCRSAAEVLQPHRQRPIAARRAQSVLERDQRDHQSVGAIAMQKVVTVDLNGRAYQIGEDAYASLDAYLRRAAEQLRSDPGRDEVIADLEQAIAEKCARYLNAHKTVITGDEIRRVLEEMGP